MGGEEGLIYSDISIRTMGGRTVLIFAVVLCQSLELVLRFTSA